MKQKEFVEAAEAQGVRPFAIIDATSCRTCWGVVVVYVTLTIPAVILAESFLSFLGLGVQPPMASLGRTRSHDGALEHESCALAADLPGDVDRVTLFCFNFIGDGLRDAIDPKDR